MKLRELLTLISNIAKQNKIAQPLICGGSVREKVNQTLNKLEDIDLTNGEASIKNLAKEVEIELGGKYSITSKTMDDGHTSLFIGKGPKSLKIDFSSNFIIPNIDQELLKIGIKNPNHLTREAFSRDFTCNSLMMDFDLKNIIDPTGKGIKDIKNKILRTCLAPDITLKYNTNRIIRVIYLAAKLGFTIDPEIVKFIKLNKNLVNYIDSNYITNTINKSCKYDANATFRSLKELDLLDIIPPNENLIPYYKTIKKSQLTHNFDYGEGFYSNLDEYKSVSDFKKKNKKKRKKRIKNIKKKAYSSGVEEYINDNFPIILNDDLQSSLDRPENKITDDVEGDSSLEPTPDGGAELKVVIPIPLINPPGNISDLSEGEVNGPDNELFQNNGLFSSHENNE